MIQRTLLPGPSQGLKAPQVTNIPEQWDANWFRSFITTHMNPYALQGIQSQQAQTPPTMTVAVNGPVQGTQVLANGATFPTTQAQWVPMQTVHLPDAVAFNVRANGGVVDLLLNEASTWGDGYMIRFDARSGQVAGQIFRMDAGAITSIGSAQAAANSAPLGGTYRVVAVIGLSGAMHLYVDGELQWSAADTTYSPNGSTYMTTEVVAGTTVFAPTAIDGTLDMSADGAQYVHLAASHAVGNVAYNFRGVYSAGNAYVKGDEVVYGQTYWLAINPSTGSTPSTSNANWQAVASYNAYQGAWSAATNYVVGDEVTYSGNYWVCVAANTNSAPTTSNANWQIAGPTNLDQVANGTTYAKTRAGTLASGVPIMSNGKNLLQNPSFEVNNIGTPVNNGILPVGTVIVDGWVIAAQQYGNTYAELANWNPQSGLYSMRIVNNQAANQTISANTVLATQVFSVDIPVRGGETLIFGGQRRMDANVSPAGLTVQQRIGLLVYQQDGTYIAETYPADLLSPGGGGWQACISSYTLPANASYVRMELCAYYVTGASSVTFTGTPGDCSFDNLFLFVQVGMDWEVQDGSTYLRMPAPPGVSANASTGLSQSGSTTTINVAACSFYVGSITLNANSGSVNPGAYGTYYVYFDDPGYGGGAVTYQASTDYRVMTQNPFRFYVGTITTASGGGGSGGGGGPSPCCLHESQMIELADGRTVSARELTTDMSLLSHEGPTPIVQLRFLPHREWFKVRLDNGVELFVAGDHRFLDDDFNQIRAWDLKLGQRVRARNGYAIVTGLDILREKATKVAIEVGEPHTYYVQGILSHNKQMCT